LLIAVMVVVVAGRVMQSKKLENPSHDAKPAYVSWCGCRLNWLYSNWETGTS
jgi:hypothetical protein